MHGAHQKLERLLISHSEFTAQLSLRLRVQAPACFVGSYFDPKPGSDLHSYSSHNTAFRFGNVNRSSCLESRIFAMSS